MVAHALVDDGSLAGADRDRHAADGIDRLLQDGLAKAPVDEVDVLVALAREPQLERTRQIVLDRRRKLLDLGIVEVAGERERRQLGAMEDLVRVRPPDPGERALVAQERVQPPVVGGQDLA